MYDLIYNMKDLSDEEHVRVAFVPENADKDDIRATSLERIFMSYLKDWIWHFEFSSDYDPSSYWFVAKEFAIFMGGKILEFEDEEIDPNMIY